MRATYFISFDGGSNYSQFYPTNSPKVKLTQEPGEIFFRWRIDSFKIGATKNQSVYTTLHTYFYDTTKFTTDIYYQIKENGVVTYEFISPVLKGKINTQDSIYECVPDPKDNYRDILAQYDKSWHMGTLTPFATHGDVFYPTLDAGQFVNIDFTTFDDSPAGTIAYTNTANAQKVARNVLAVTITTGRVVVVTINNINITTGDDPRIAIADSLGNICSNQEFISANGVYVLTALNNSGDRVQFSQTDDISGSAGSLDYVIYHYMSNWNDVGAPLYNAINDVLTNASWMNLSIPTVYSTILFNDSLGSDPPPNIDTYITANPTNDYVIEGAAIWNDLWIGRVDVLTTAKEEDFEYSLKDILDVLKKLRLWWFIDEDGHFRIEHEKYFRDYAAQADLTAIGFITDKPEDDRKIYDYEMGNLYTQINHEENNQSNEDFIAAPIDYNNLVTSTNVNDLRFNVSTDVKYIIDSPDNADATGFILLRCKDMGVSWRVAIDESTKTAGVFYPNAKLGWYYLFANYYKYFAEAETGTLNGGAFTFDHVKEFLTQKNIRFHPTAIIDWKKPFTLTGGTGWLISAEYEPESGMAEINIGFNPYA